VPQEIKQWMLLRIGLIYDNREAVAAGVTSLTELQARRPPARPIPRLGHVMRGSQLKDRITIQVNQPAPDPVYGRPTDNWVTYNGAARIPAQVLDSLPSKAEQEKDGVRIGTQGTRVRIRYLAGVTAAMRIVRHGAADRVMQIVAGPAEIGRREWLEFMAEEYRV
jgi:head-tail adaptor